MIQKTEVMDLLLSACPSFQKKWTIYLTEMEEGEEHLLYVELVEFARHLIELFKTQNISEFNDVFNVVEQLHIEGDNFVQEAATIGLLEGIQNNALHEGIDPEFFKDYLKPETKKWWLRLNNFWSGESELV